MRICVVNLTTKDIVDDVYESNLNKIKYCQKYNLDYRFYLGRASKRHAQWDKIQCVMQNLPEYDYIVWIDSDAIFNNFDISLEKFIEENSNYDALFCSDVCYSKGQNHLLVNSGVMIFKNTKWSFEILSKVWHSVEDYSIDTLNKHSYDGFPHEQGKLCDILLRENEQNKFKIFPSATFNQHPNSSNDQTFIVHFMGSRQTKEHINTFQQKVKKANSRLNINNLDPINYINLKPLNLCIISSYTDNIKDVADITVSNKKKYCEKHGYALAINEGRLSLRHPGWDKIKLISNKINIETYDYFIWIDNDAYITNENLRFDFICANYHNKNLIICSESESSNITYLDPNTDFNILSNLRLINTGVFIIKNNSWGKEFLDEIWNTKSNTNQGIQGSHSEIHSNSFTYAFWPFEQGPLHIVLSRRNPSDYQILKNYVMNIFKNQHQKQHFICHFVGNNNNAQNIIDYISQLNNDDIINKTLLQETSHEILFKNNKCYLQYNIYQNNDNLDMCLLKYTWDFSNTKEKNLSHCFRINNDKEISFGSEHSGQFSYKKNDTIEHSYDWFGEKKWIKLI